MLQLSVTDLISHMFYIKLKVMSVCESVLSVINNFLFYGRWGGLGVCDMVGCCGLSVVIRCTRGHTETLSPLLLPELLSSSLSSCLSPVHHLHGLCTSQHPPHGPFNPSPSSPPPPPPLTPPSTQPLLPPLTSSTTCWTTSPVSHQTEHDSTRSRV